MSKRSVRAIAVVVPVMLVGLYMASNASATLSQRSLRERWETTTARGTLSPVALAAHTFRPGEPVARIAAPAISLDVIVVEGGNGHRGPAHLESTATPGTNGVSIVRGGRFGFGNFFLGLSRLRPGDEIVVQNLSGEVRLVVDSVRTARTLELGQDSEDPVLELISPSRMWGSTDLVVVRAVTPSEESQ